MDDTKVKTLQEQAYEQLMTRLAAAEAKDKARAQKDPHLQERRIIISSLVTARYKQKITPTPASTRCVALSKHLGSTLW